MSIIIIIIFIIIERQEQVVLVRLGTGHNRLSAYIVQKTEAGALTYLQQCGLEDQTTLRTRTSALPQPPATETDRLAG